VPALFTWLQRGGGVSDDEMFRAFNMGVGLVLVCAREHAEPLLSALQTAGEPAWQLGDVA
jgi:phosphoribosylformylglycinamidine cyclo-ligase